MNKLVSLSYNMKESSKVILLLFSLLLLCNIGYSTFIYNNDTIRIDDRLVVIEKQLVDTLDDIPQEEYKDILEHQKYVLVYGGWDISPFSLKSISGDYELINEFVTIKNSASFSNFNIGGTFGVQTKSNWNFEIGVELFSSSFDSQQFDVSLLLDSTINDVTNYSLEGFIAEENELYQRAFEYFDIGPEERIKKLEIQNIRNSITFLHIPVLVGHSWQLNKQIEFTAKAGVINSFVINNDIKTQFLLNETKKYVLVDGLEFQKYIAQVQIQPIITFYSASKMKNFYVGLNGVIPVSSYFKSSEYLSLSNNYFGLKMGVRINLF